MTSNGNASKSKNNIQKEIYTFLLKHGIELTKEQAEDLYKKISDILNYVPKVGVLGKTGVGKSTLCNALFGQDVAEVSHILPGTVKPQEVFIELDKEKGIMLVDCPGVGESEDKNHEYAKLYKECIPKFDLVLWLVRADDRAYATEERFYNSIVKPFLNANIPFIVVVNQVDKVEPFREWDVKNAKPSEEQVENINLKLEVVSKLFGLPNSNVIPVSATEKYKLVELLDQIVRSLPPEKQYAMIREALDSIVSDETKRRARAALAKKIGEYLLKAGKVLGAAALVGLAVLVGGSLVAGLGEDT